MTPKTMTVSYRYEAPKPVYVTFEGEPLTLRGNVAFLYRWIAQYRSEDEARELLRPELAAQRNARLEAIKKAATAPQQIAAPTL